MTKTERQPDDFLLKVEGLKKHFPIKKGLLSRTVGTIKAVDGVSFTIHRGETLSLVGESGSGKTTVGRMITRVYKPTAGKILFRRGDSETVDLAKLNSAELRPIRRHIQMIFQDPYTSLNPRKSIRDIVGEPLRLDQNLRGHQLEERVKELLRQAGLSPGLMMRYPHAFSGGQRQRVGIARALALEPEFIVADEPISALDVSVQAQILNLLKRLQLDHGVTYLLIAHDLSTVEHISNRVAVMYVGKLVELAETHELFTRPMHPYTEALLSAVPRPIPTKHPKRIKLTGEVADPAHPPSGCHFHPRCQYATELCAREEPEFRELRSGHFVSCHYADQLTLAGTEPAQRLATVT